MLCYVMLYYDPGQLRAQGDRADADGALVADEWGQYVYIYIYIYMYAYIHIIILNYTMLYPICPCPRAGHERGHARGGPLGYCCQ